MKQVGDMKLYDFDEFLDEEYGPVGTPERDEFERDVDECVSAYKLGEALKKARISQHLTQEQLAERIGTKKTYISKIENGHTDIQLTTLFRIFAGLGKRVSITLV